MLYQLKALIAGLLACVAVTAAAAGPTTLQPQDLFGLSLAGAPEIRPDGKLIAYVRTSNDAMTDIGVRSVWLVDPRTGVQTPVATTGDNSGAVWSPDGSRIAYVSKNGAGSPEIYVYWLANGQVARVTRLERTPSRLAWSPDGRSIAFLMAEPHPAPVLGTPLVHPEGSKWAEPLEVIDTLTYRVDGVGQLKPGNEHVYAVAADGGAPRQLTFGVFEDSGPLSWAADGSAVVFLARRGDNWQREALHFGIYRVALADATLTKLTEHEGPYAGARVSPDGRHIAYSSYDDRNRGYENRRIFVMDVDGHNSRMLSGTLDRGLDNPRWAPDGRGIYADCTDHGVTKVVRLGLDGRFADVATGLAGDGFDLPYTGGEFAVGPNDMVAFTQGAAEHPSDLAIVQKAKVTRLTHLNDGLLNHRTLGAVEPLTVKSSFDGAAIDTWLVLPPHFDHNRKYPMILEIHGGPFANYGATFATDGQLYAAAGYVVVYANPRGSTSYGEKFANGINHSYPGTDYDDLMSAVDATIAKGFVDPARLFVTGGSGGGVLTAWIVGKTRRFRAAVAQKPVVNWSSEMLTSDIYSWIGKYWFGKQPWEDPQAYWARSPLSLAGNITTPTLVIVGGNDIRTPVSEAEQLYGALQLRGVPTALVKVPGAYHDMAARPSQAAAKANAVLAWFARYDSAPVRP